MRYPSVPGNSSFENSGARMLIWCFSARPRLIQLPRYSWRRGGVGERERQRERESERDRERERERARETESERQRERERDRQTDRQADSERSRERERERARARARKCVWVWAWVWGEVHLSVAFDAVAHEQDRRVFWQPLSWLWRSMP